MKTYQECVEALHAKYIEKLKATALEAFEADVKPFCDRHGLWLVQEMNQYTGNKFFGTPGDATVTSSDWDDYLDDPKLREASPELRPPEGYAELREGVFFDLPGGGDIGWSLLWLMPEYKPEVKRG